jgi:hypothetical protein
MAPKITCQESTPLDWLFPTFETMLYGIIDASEHHGFVHLVSGPNNTTAVWPRMINTPSSSAYMFHSGGVHIERRYRDEHL